MVGIEAVENPDTWDDLPTIVVEKTDRILKILDDHNTKATFFILGWIANKYPQIVERISEQGHEVGTHSYWHRRVFDLDQDEFRKDIQDSIDAITRACPGVEVRSFRAPSFSIIEGTEWAFDVLLDCGIEYDTSLFPGPRGNGGYDSCPAGAHIVTTPTGRKLPELPISTAKFGPVSLCYSGGGYMRLLPSMLIEHGFRQESKEGRPTVVYLHPRDIAPDSPHVPMPLHRRFKSRVGLATAERKLRTLLARHSFSTCRDVLENCLSRAGLEMPRRETAGAV